jgi:hypothetical protein
MILALVAAVAIRASTNETSPFERMVKEELALGSEDCRTFGSSFVGTPRFLWIPENVWKGKKAKFESVMKSNGYRFNPATEQYANSSTKLSSLVEIYRLPDDFKALPLDHPEWLTDTTNGVVFGFE